MGELWLKVWVWIKGIVLALLAFYVILFAYNNSGDSELWWWFNHTWRSSKLLMMGVCFIAGMLTVVLAGTTLRTMRQIKDLRSRSRTDRLEREMADMRSKAAMLQTRPASSTGATTSLIDQEPLE
jgi:uncharacterized integral membrane protein